MDDKKIRDNDAYDDLLKSFSSSRKNEKPDDEVRNHGEIYFSVNSPRNTTARQTTHVRAANAQKKAVPQKKRAENTVAVNNKKTESGTKPNKRPSAKRRKRKAKNSFQGLLIALVIVAISVLSAFLLKTTVMNCINDILAINASTTEYRVILEKDMEVDDVIDVLSEKNLINSKAFCLLFAEIRDLGVDTDRDGFERAIIYPAGTYHLSASMGLEGMLLEIRTNGVESNTVKLTFPEGYNVVQIAQKLDENGVCSAYDFYAAMNDEALFERYEFLSSVTDKQLRYRVLEGYLYPDTYEFYIGEAASSVVERFLENFESKWTETYASRAQELGYTVDEILTVASILEKEAFDAEQMTVIASVIYNRLESSSFPYINCDSTGKYIENFRESLEAEGNYAEYMKVYDTYQQTGLPIGAIGCPGADAIYSALYPETTDYYYFLHDSEGKIYLASDAAEHQANMQYLN